MYNMGGICDIKGVDIDDRRWDEDGVCLVQGCCREFFNVLYRYHCIGYNSSDERDIIGCCWGRTDIVKLGWVCGYNERDREL